MKHIPTFSKEAIQNAKNNFDCIEYVKTRTAKYIQYGHKILACCLFHDDKNPSMSVSNKGFFCYACDASGDAIKLVASYNNGYFIDDVSGNSFIEACSEIGAMESVEPPIKRDDFCQASHSDLSDLFSNAILNREIADKYLLDRDIMSAAINFGAFTPESTIQFHHKYPFLKNYRWLCFPMYNAFDNLVSKELVGLNLRNIDSDGKDIKHRKIGCTGVFQKLRNFDDDFVPLDQTIGCESGTDCLKLDMPATAIFGISNASKYVFKGTAYDHDKAGISATNMRSLLLYDGHDVADSTNFLHVCLDLANLEEKCAALLLFSPDVQLIDQLLRTTYIASHYSDEIRAMFVIIDGMFARTSLNFFEQMIRCYDLDFDKTDSTKQRTQAQHLYYLYRNLYRIYNEIMHRNDATQDDEKPYLQSLVTNIRLVLPTRMVGRISDKNWRAFEKGLTKPEPTQDFQNLLPLKSYKVDGIPDYCLRMGGLTVLAGHSNSGKTHLAFYMIASIVKNDPDAKIVFFSLETNEFLVRECLDEYELCDQARIQVVDRIVNIGYLTKLMKLYIDQGYTHFFIDNAKILYQEDHSAMDRAVRELEILAGTTCISIILLAQLLKNVDSSHYYYARRHDIHGGGSLYDRADCVLVIQEYSPNISKADQKAKDSASLKYRHISIEKTRAAIDTTMTQPIIDFKKLNPNKAKVIVTICKEKY